MQLGLEIEVGCVSLVWYVLGNAEISEKTSVLLGNWKNQEKVQGMEWWAYDIDVDRLEREKPEGF